MTTATTSAERAKRLLADDRILRDGRLNYEWLERAIASTIQEAVDDAYKQIESALRWRMRVADGDLTRTPQTMIDEREIGFVIADARTLKSKSGTKGNAATG